jgi:D-alanyl-D-alanine carboxypeptidase/D-alanyl-D-alanine-endopeptidase (penicillin-binding protein 4)
LPRGRIILSASDHEIALYAGHLLHHFLEEHDVLQTGIIRLGETGKADERLILAFKSPFLLTEVIAKLHQFSNNFIANQILIASGHNLLGPPGTLSKGLVAANRYIRSELKLNGVNMVEGSGISRENRLSAAQMDHVLQRFAPFHHLLRQEGRDFYKTGTLKGVRTRAGYIQGRNGKLIRYVVFINTPGHGTAPIMQKILLSI